MPRRAGLGKSSRIGSDPGPPFGGCAEARLGSAGARQWPLRPAIHHLRQLRSVDESLFRTWRETNLTAFNAAATGGVIHNRTTGGLFYDSNGNAAGGVTQLATLTTKPTLTAADFQVI
jgi:hypothetical protein